MNADHIDARAVAAAGQMLQLRCHGDSCLAGWWQHDGVDLRDQIRSRSRFGLALAAEKIALIHSEGSESLEGLRKDKQDEHLPHRKSIEVELADQVIRIADLAGALNLDLGSAIAEKLAYNQVRLDHKPEARRAAGGKAI